MNIWVSSCKFFGKTLDLKHENNLVYFLIIEWSHPVIVLLRWWMKDPLQPDMDNQHSTFNNSWIKSVK